MPESEVSKVAKNYYFNIPFANKGDFFVKGAGGYDWGMKRRLANIFSPKTGRTVIFALDHGCCMGSPAGLERPDLLVPKMVSNIDALMCNRGILRSCVSPEHKKALILNAGYSAKIPAEDEPRSFFAVDIEDAVRLNADCVAVQVFISADGQIEGMETLSKAVNAGMQYGIPVMGVVTLVKGAERSTKHIKIATRMAAELGAAVVNTCYCEDFDEVCAACPAPVVVSGGKKIAENEALTLAYKAVLSGAGGIAFGRNIFQCAFPVEMASALGKIVHDGFTDKEAWQFFQELINR